MITSMHEGAWQCSHVPLFFDEGRDELFGHVDARNEQFDVSAPFSAQLVFAGPDAYIPPEGYVTRQLPTWNYLAVHATGMVSVIEDVSLNLEILRRSALRLASTPSTFRVDDNDSRVHQWIGGIRGLHVALDSLEGRFKLSQDKQPRDVVAAAQHFSRVAIERSSTDLLLGFAGQSFVEESQS
jgi:transcriptional regulator